MSEERFDGKTHVRDEATNSAGGGTVCAVPIGSSGYIVVRCDKPKGHDNGIHESRGIVCRHCGAIAESPFHNWPDDPEAHKFDAAPAEQNELRNVAFYGSERGGWPCQVCGYGHVANSPCADPVGPHCKFIFADGSVCGKLESGHVFGLHMHKFVKSSPFIPAAQPVPRATISALLPYLRHINGCQYPQEFIPPGSDAPRKCNCTCGLLKIAEGVMPDAKVEEIAQKSDNAYCDYVAQMRKPECLGYEQKLKDGTFGKAELDAHTRAGELLGRHRAFAEVAAILRPYFPADAPQSIHNFKLEDYVGGKEVPQPVIFDPRRESIHVEEPAAPVDYYLEYQKVVAEVVELRAWKESAMKLLPLQEWGEALGLKLGESIHDNVLPALLRLNAAETQLKTVQEALRWSLGYLKKLVHVTEDGAAFIHNTVTELAGFGPRLHEAEAALSGTPPPKD